MLLRRVLMLIFASLVLTRVVMVTAKEPTFAVLTYLLAGVFVYLVVLSLQI